MFQRDDSKTPADNERFCKEMRIEKIIENKKQFLDLLLLADEQENMIDKYLARGDLFALYEQPIFEGEIQLVDMIYLKKEI